MSKSRLHQLSELGQSVWIDSLSREWLRTGELARMMDEDAVVGVTSNPTIFQKAMSRGRWYDDQLREVLAEEDDLKEIFLSLAFDDIAEACDLSALRLGPTDGLDGSSRSRSIRTWPTTRRRRSRRRSASTTRSTGRTST